MITFSPISKVSVPKKTGSYADVLVAVGFADLLQQIKRTNDPSAKTVICDAGDRYELELKPALLPEDFNAWVPWPGYKYIKVKNDDADCPLGDYFPYEEAREKEKLYREFQKSLTKQAKKVAAALDREGLDSPEPPPDELTVIKTYNAMRMGSNSYNLLHKELRQCNVLPKLVLKRLGVTVESEGLAEAEKSLHRTASMLQLFNPVSGKGTHRPKPDSSAAAGYPDKLVDWFEEWMKFRAMLLAMLTYPVGDDTKVFVIVPHKTTLDQVVILWRELLNKKLYGAVTLEIQAALNTAKFLVKTSREYVGQTGTYSAGGRKPKEIIAGFHTAYFKSLGTASATMNVSFLGLPGWLPVSNYEEAEAWIEILDEHQICLKSLNEKHSGEMPLLLTYRDFISTGRLEVVLDFFADYGTHYMRRKGNNDWAAAFTSKNLRRLFMSYNLQEIVENSGFQNIARAIRRATVYAQIEKSKTGKASFEIQYGLAQDWKRKVKFQDQFISELADFVQRYNAETARHIEQGKVGRGMVNTKDLSDVIELVRKHSSELVGMLLLAYGYAIEKDNDKE